MTTKQERQLPNTTRRSLLIGAVAGALTPQLAAAASGGSAAVTDAPESDSVHQRQAFYGEHQPGIVTPRPAAGLVASFDVLVQNRAGLQRLLKTLTERTAFLMAGGTPPTLDPKFPRRRFRHSRPGGDAGQPDNNHLARRLALRRPLRP